MVTALRRPLPPPRRPHDDPRQTTAPVRDVGRGRAGPVAWSGGLDAYVGRWSRVVARRFLDRLAVPAGSRWLDVGCGTGAITGQVLRTCAPAVVLGLEPSDPFVARAAVHVRDRRAAFCRGSAHDLPSATCRWMRSSPGWCSN